MKTQDDRFVLKFYTRCNSSKYGSVYSNRHILFSLRRKAGFGIALRRMAMRSFWETEMMVMKPRTVRMKTTRALATSQSLTSPSRAYCKQGRWVSLTKGQKLMAIHPSGEIITEGPIAPASSNLVIVSSTEVCDHLNGVAHCGRGKRRIVPTRGRGA